MNSVLNRRALLQGSVATAGAAALIQGSFAPTAAQAQGALPAGTVHSFSTGGVTCHTYVSPVQAVNVTSHVIELGDQILLADATFLPSTAAEVVQLIDVIGKPVHTAYVSHEHPDHWAGVSTFEGGEFLTLPEIRDGLRAEATGGEQPEPITLLNGGDLALGMSDIGGVPVEFRAYDNAEAPKTIVAVLPEQRVAIVQDLVYNGVYFAPGVDRKNWIATLENMRDDPSFDTLLVGHGLPTSRGELTIAIDYLKTLDAVWETASTPDEVIAAIMAAYPGYGGEFLLGLTAEYWDK